MILVNWNAANAYLLDDMPEWGQNISVDVNIPSAYERSLTGKETRRGTGDTPRLNLKYRTLLCQEAIMNLRNSLQAISQEPVLCPFWPGVFQPGTLPIVTANWYVLLDGLAAPSIQASAALGAGFARIAYPLMVGILSKTSDPALLTPENAWFDYEFSENDNVNVLSFPALNIPLPLLDAGGNQIDDAKSNPITTF